MKVSPAGLAKLRDLGRRAAMRWPALSRVAAPEGSRRRAFLARLTRAKPVLGEPLVVPLAHTPSPQDIRFSAAGEPLVSAVIPVYRKVDLTLRCLGALAEAQLSDRLEVIVVDDASGDGSADVLRGADGLTIVEMPENVGYLLATNAGISAARGEFVLLLNNDVEVHAGAIRTLVEALQRRPSAGAAGARLLYADGTLQEAGSIIWNDGSGWSYGKGEDPRSPAFAHVRPVDYCSAACLLVRRGALAEIGGFDARYAPAYYEDSDLAFALRASGLETLYVPAAFALHHEGASHGTSVRSGVKAYQARNRERFREKWAKELTAQSRPDVTGVVVSRDRRAGPRVLVAGRKSAEGAALAAYAAQRGAVVTLVSPDGMAEQEMSGLRDAGIEVWPETDAGLTSHLRLLAPHLSAVVLAGGGDPPPWLARVSLSRLPIVDGSDPSALDTALPS